MEYKNGNTINRFPGKAYSLTELSDFAYLKRGMMLNGVIHPKQVLEPSETNFKGLLRTPTASDSGRGKNGGRLGIGIETLKREAVIGGHRKSGSKYQQSLVHNVAAVSNKYPSPELYEYLMGFPVGWTLL